MGYNPAMHPLIGRDDPAPFVILHEHGTAPALVICDHASRAFPKAMNRLGLRMIVNQGFGSVLGFSRGILGIHGSGKRAVARFVDAANGRNKVALAELFARVNAGIGFPGEREILDAESFCDRLSGPLSVTKLISSGYVTSCTFNVRCGDSERRGLGLFEFNSRSRKLHSVRLYCE